MEGKGMWYGSFPTKHIQLLQKEYIRWAQFGKSFSIGSKNEWALLIRELGNVPELQARQKHRQNWNLTWWAKGALRKWSKSVKFLSGAALAGTTGEGKSNYAQKACFPSLSAGRIPWYSIPNDSIGHESVFIWSLSWLQVFHCVCCFLCYFSF